MALDPKLVKILDDFADSQPALQLPGEPSGSANPKLGTALDEAIDSAAGGESGISPVESPTQDAFLAIEDIELDTSDTYTDAAVNSAVNAAIGQANDALAVINDNVAAIVAALVDSGVFESL